MKLKLELLALICAVAMLASCGSPGNLPCVGDDMNGASNGKSFYRNEQNLPTVMKIGRTTCVPCRKMSKLLGQMGPSLEGKAVVSIVDIDEDPDAVKRYSVTGIPVTIFFDREGNEKYRQIGVLEENEIMDWLIVSGMGK